MGHLTLYAGLLLPWLGGTLWLSYVESRFEPDNHHNRIRQAGYGFFFGYAVLFMAVMTIESFMGASSRNIVMLFLAIFTGTGGLAAWLTRATPVPGHQAREGSRQIAAKLLTVLVLAWMALHLAFITIDIFTQPVYPWDAWLAWVYRAKAWYLNAGISTLISPAQWLSSSAADVYSIDAWIYPLLPSVIPYWAALSLGQWSETLVSLPVLFAGIAIGMALYGQCREHGLGVTTSLLCCYLLYSIPIFGTHIALAGYADIWMAGFSGLGFIAILRAAFIRGSTTAKNHGQGYAMQLAIGFLMLALGILVKNEGVVWLLTALALLLLVSCRVRVLTLIAVGLAVLALLGVILDTSHVNIPLIGTLGIVDGRLSVPFIGNFGLELHNIWRVYWDNFIIMGNWNLLWVLVLLSLVSCMRSPRNSVKRVGLAFIAIFLMTQLFIFGLTDQGLWADTFTAINRLPIHFTPALLFVAFVILHHDLVGESRSPLHMPARPRPASEDRRLWGIALLPVVIVLTGLLAYLASGLPDKNTEALDYPATGFTFASGSGHTRQEYMVVDGFVNGYALLSSRAVNIEAARLVVLEYDWIPTRPQQTAAFFWRQKGQPENVLRVDITTPGSGMIDLSMETGWRGDIIEFGFLASGSPGEIVSIGSARLQADSLQLRIRLMWQAWTSFEERSQQTINFLQGGDDRQLVPLPLLLIAWLLASALVMLLWRNKAATPGTQARLRLFYLVLLTGWMLLDIRWTANGYKQTILSLQTLSQADDDQRLRTGLDGEIYQYVERLKTNVFADKPARVLILGDKDAIDYYLLRAKYHLLPINANVVSGLNPQLSPESIDYVIFFGLPNGITKTPGMNPAWREHLVEIDRGSLATVFRVDS